MTSQHDNSVKKRQTYSREFCLKLKDSCQQLPANLHADALSDLSETAFFDRGHRPGSLQYDRQRQHSALIAPTLPLGPSVGEVSSGMGRGRGKFGPPPGGAAPSMGSGSGSGGPQVGAGGSRFFDTSSSSSSGPTQQQSAFASSSPSRHTFLQPRRTSFAEDRWDSRKIAAGSSPSKTQGGTHSALVHQDGPGRAQSVPGSITTSKEGRWGKSGAADEGDWRSKKATPRYDWAENSKQGSLQSHQNGQSGGLQSKGKGSSSAPEWADEDATSKMSVTAQEIEAERQRMQAQWRKAGGTANSAAEASMQELIDDDEIEMWKREAEEQEAKQGQGRGETPASRQEAMLGQALEPQGVQASAGQPVDLNSLFGKGIQPPAPAPAPPLSTPAASQRIGEPNKEQEQLQSKFEALFSLQNNRPPPVSNFPPHFPPPPLPQDGQDAGKLLLEMLQKSGGASAGVSRPPTGPQGPLLPPVPPPGFVAGPNASMGSLPYPHPHPHPMMPPIHPQRPPPAPGGHFPPLPVSQYPPEYPKYLQGGFPVPNNIGLQQQSGAGPVPVHMGGVPPLSMQYMPPQFQMQPGPNQGGGQFVPGMQHHLPQHQPSQQQQQSQLLAQLFAGAGVPQAPNSQQQQYTPQQLAQLEALRVRAGGPPSNMSMGMGVGLPDPNQNSHQPMPLHYMQNLGMRPPPPQQQQQQQQ